jgi:hypothetical protein
MPNGTFVFFFSPFFKMAAKAERLGQNIDEIFDF